jgi:hypothetical protein
VSAATQQPERARCSFCGKPDRAVAVAYVPHRGRLRFGETPALEWERAAYACKACSAGEDELVVQRRLAELEPSRNARGRFLFVDVEITR